MELTIEKILERWDNLSPRERDAWVAEKVMGWKLDEVGLWSGTKYSHYPPHPAYAMCSNSYFSPSTDISVALEVVGKMRDNTGRDLEFARELTRLASIDNRITLPGQIIWNLFYGLEKLPSLICKAALLAALEVTP